MFYDNVEVATNDNNFLGLKNKKVVLPKNFILPNSNEERNELAKSKNKIYSNLFI